MREHKITKDNYLQAAQMDKQSTKNYFAKSINKTEQQKALESLLLDSITKGELDRNASYKIADLACGGGTLSYHLSSFFPNASFVLLDYNEDGLELAKEINTESKDRMEFIQGDLRDLPFEYSSFDLVFCWGVFLIFNEKDLQPIINEVHRILKPNGKLYASSLFNTEFDVDLVCDFKDLTKESGKAGIWGRYTTFSLPTMRKILQSYSTFSIHPFEPQIDFPRTTHRGIATYSVKVLQDSHLIEVDKNFGGAFVGETKSERNITGGGIHTESRLQISAGMLMNWGILEATK